MALKKWAQGEIAGVSLDVSGSPTKCLIMDAANLRTTRVVNQRQSADGQIYTQGFESSGHGQKFGLKFDNIPLDKLNSIVQAVESAIDGNSGFSVDLQDDVTTVSGEFTVDGNQWLQIPEQITNDQFVANVTMRFLRVG